MRFSLRLMVLTSLSVHLIALLICILASSHPAHLSGRSSGAETGPMIIISKSEAPVPPPQPASDRTPPPRPPAAPPPIAPAVSNSHAARFSTPESILSARGGPHLHGGVVFILDISGSMYEPYAGSTRLALARRFLSQQITSLPNGTPFAIVLYGETTRASGPLVTADEDTRGAAVHFINEDFDCGGGTNLPAGLVVAQDLDPSRLVLVTDGDLNIADAKLMTEARNILGEPGPHLSVYGIAPRGTTDDADLLQDLVRQQEGSYQEMEAGGK